MRAALLAIVLCASSAHADEPPAVRAALQWWRLPGGDECIGAEALGSAVEEYLGRRAFFPSRTDVVLAGRIGPARSGLGWHASLEMRTPDGALVGIREIDTRSDRCSALDQPLALVIALMIDLPKDEIRLQVPARRAPAWRAQAAVGTALALELLPGAAFGVELGFGVERSKAFGLELVSTLFLPTDVEATESGARFDAWLVGLNACPLRLTFGRLGLRACAGPEIGSVRAAGFGLDFNRSVRDFLVLVRAGARAEVRLWRRLALRIDSGFAVNALEPDRFAFEASDGRVRELHRLPRVFPRASVGLVLDLP